MRWLLALLLVLSPLPAHAAGWGHYLNARFNYAVDVPPGFAGQVESDNGDGQVFKTPGATLTVFGGNIVEADFESEVVQRERSVEHDGWAITYQLSTPAKASFSGKQGGRIIYVRMIALCGGTQFAAFELSYGSSSVATFNPVVDRLVASLRPANGSGCS